MAATISTMLGTCRAVSTPSRRELVGGSLLAALSSAVFAAAVLPPNRDDLAVADTVTPADAALIDLCAACDALTHQAKALWQGVTRIADDARDVALTRIDEQQAPLLKQLCKVCPTTAYGHAVRARTLLLWDKDPCWTRSACLDEALAAAVVRDLARGA